MINIPLSIKITLAFSLVILATVVVISLHTRERFNYNFQRFCEISGFEDRRCLKGLVGRKFVEAIDNSLISSGFLAIVLAFIVSLYLSSYILKPLKDVANAARAFKKGDYDVRIQTSTNDELNDLISTMNDLFEKISLNDRLKRDLIANISHEVFTPLTNIKGYIEAINDGVIKDKEEVSKTLNIIDEETTRVISLVRQMKELSFIESDKMMLNKTKVSVKDLISDMVTRFKNQAGKKNLEFKIDVDDIDIRVDKEKFTLALLNIISNSIKYSRENGKIEINAKKIDEKVEISIKDHGIGIPENDIPFIFERFYRVDKSRTDGESIGIGLTIAKKIIEANHGKITVESEYGKWAKFTVII